MLEKILLQLKITQVFDTHVNLNRAELHEQLKTKIDAASLGFMSDATDVFGTNGSKFKGYLDKEKFLIKYKRTMFSGFNNIPIIAGKISEENGKTNIRTSISAYTGLTAVLLIVVLLATVSSLLFNTGYSNVDGPNFLVISLVLLCVGVTFIYFVMRISVYSVKKKIKSILFQFD